MLENDGFCSFTSNKQTCELSCQRFRPGLATGRPESQQPTGSQIIRICMEIYLKIDKMVKMDKVQDVSKVRIRPDCKLYFAQSIFKKCFFEQI